MALCYVHIRGIIPIHKLDVILILPSKNPFKRSLYLTDIYIRRVNQLSIQSSASTHGLAATESPLTRDTRLRDVEMFGLAAAFHGRYREVAIGSHMMSMAHAG